ncbi:hypothetical protein BST61_g4992 [Cercospora zeina]
MLKSYYCTIGFLGTWLNQSSVRCARSRSTQSFVSPILAVNEKARGALRAFVPGTFVNPSFFHYTFPFAAGASAATLRRGDMNGSCGFHIKSSGGIDCTMGQFQDGQNRLNGSYPVATYYFDNGGITDDHGRPCIVTTTNDATHQFQCDENSPGGPTRGFTISSDGSISYNGNTQFYACKYINEYNIYTEKLKDQDMCLPIELSADEDCAAGSYGNGQPPASGNGQPPAYGNGQPPASGNGQPPAYGNGQPPASGNGQPPASGNGQPPASGNGQPPASGNGQPPAYGNGQPPASGNGQPPASGNGQPPAYGNGQPPASGNGQPPASGNGQPPASGNGQPPAYGNGQPPASGNGQPPASGNGQPPAYGNGQPPASGNGQPPAYGNGQPPTPNSPTSPNQPQQPPASPQQPPAYGQPPKPSSPTSPNQPPSSPQQPPAYGKPPASAPPQSAVTTTTTVYVSCTQTCSETHSVGTPHSVVPGPTYSSGTSPVVQPTQSHGTPISSTATTAVPSQSASCPAPGSTDNMGRYSCNPAHQYPGGQTCQLQNGCYFLTTSSSTVSSPVSAQTPSCPAPGSADSMGRYSCNPAHQYPGGQSCQLQNGCYFLTTSSSTVSSPVSAQTPSCPAPGSADSMGRYSCNPAHQYPGGQSCQLQNGCYFLTTSSSTVSSPVSAQTPSCPAPGSADSMGRYSCNPAHQYPGGQSCQLQNGCYFLTTSSSTVSSPVSAQTPSCPAPGSADSMGRYSCNPAHQYPAGQTCQLANGCYYLTTSSSTSSTPQATVPTASASTPVNYGATTSSTTTRVVKTSIVKSTVVVTPSSSASSTSTAPASPTSTTPGSCGSALVEGYYLIPELIIWISETHPATAYGSKQNATINVESSSVFTFDIPADYEGKQCNVVFLFPEDESNWSWNHKGSMEFNSLNGAVTGQTTYATSPSKDQCLGSITPQPGNSYVVSTAPCQAGEIITIETSSQEDLELEFCEDANKPPVGGMGVIVGRDLLTYSIVMPARF